MLLEMVLQCQAADAGAAADVEYLAGHEAVGRIGEEADGARHVGRLAEPAHGHRGGELALAVAALLLWRRVPFLPMVAAAAATAAVIRALG